MAAAFVGQLVIAIDGKPVIYASSFKERVTTNREEVVGMTPSGTPAGYVEGTKQFELNISAYKPKTLDMAWEDITNATLIGVPRDGGAPVVFYTGVYVKDVSRSYEEKGAAKVDITCGALIKGTV